LLARLLGPANYGYFAVISSVSIVAGFVATLGVNRALLKYIALHSVRRSINELALRQRLAVHVLRVSLPAVGIVTAVVLVDVVGFRGTPRLALTVAVAALVALSGLQLVMADALRGHRHRVAAAFLEGQSGGAISFVALTVVLLPFVGHRIGLTTATALNVLAYALVLPIWWRFLRRRWRRVSREGRRAQRLERRRPPDQRQPWERSFLVLALTLMGTQITTFAASQADLWVVGATVPATDLSLFSAAFKLITVIGMPLYAARLALTPSVVALYSSGRIGELQSVTRRAASVAMIPALLSLALIVAEPRDLMTWIFGAGYAGGSQVLVWLTIGQAVNGLTGICGVVLAMTGYQRDALVIGLAAVAVKLAIGVPVALSSGIVAYAAVTSITTAAMNVAYLLFVRLRIGIWTFPSLRLGRMSA